MAELDLGKICVALAKDSDGTRYARIRLPDGSEVVEPFSAEGTLQMSLRAMMVLGGWGTWTDWGNWPGGSGAPEWIPEGADYYADPVNGNYAIGGSVVSVSDAFQALASRVVPGVGYVQTAEHQAGDLTVPELLTGGTYVVDLAIADIESLTLPVGSGYVVVLREDEWGDEAGLQIPGGSDGDPPTPFGYFSAYIDGDGPGTFVPDDDNVVHSNETARIAFTVSLDEVSLSVNGAPALTAVPSVFPPMNRFVFGDYAPGLTGRPITIRRLVKFPSRPLADLPALSALS